MYVYIIFISNEHSHLLKVNSPCLLTHCMYQCITVASKLPALYFTFALPSLKAYYSSHSNLHKNEAISYILFQPMLTSYHFILVQDLLTLSMYYYCVLCVYWYIYTYCNFLKRNRIPQVQFTLHILLEGSIYVPTYIHMH